MLEQAGRPTLVVATVAFEALAEEAARAQNLAALRMAVVEHPIGGIAPTELRSRADVAVEECLGILAGDETKRTRSDKT